LRLQVERLALVVVVVVVVAVVALVAETVVVSCGQLWALFFSPLLELVVGRRVATRASL